MLVVTSNNGKLIIQLEWPYGRFSNIQSHFNINIFRHEYLLLYHLRMSISLYYLATIIYLN